LAYCEKCKKTFDECTCYEQDKGPVLSAQERAIVESMMEAWLAAGMPLPGDITYEDVGQFLDRIGCSRRLFEAALIARDFPEKPRAEEASQAQPS